MRCSLFVPVANLAHYLHSKAYIPLEQQAIAAELAGFSAVWIADQWTRVPPRLPTALALARQLSVVTDRVDLGLVLRLPPPSLRAALITELCSLDDLSSGRIRVAFDLRGLNAAEHEAGLALLETLAEALMLRQHPTLARQLALVAEEIAVVPAAVGGFGLMLTPGDLLHERRLWLARYHDQRETRPGWISRLLTIALAADKSELATIQRALPPETALLSPAAEPALLGLSAQLVAQLAVAQLADGLDELICAFAPGWPRPERLADTVDRLGHEVVRQLQPSSNRPIPRRRKQ